MTRRVLIAATLLSTAVAAQGPRPATTMRFDDPVTLATIADDVKGQPSRLAWSPDGTELYFQTLEGAFGQKNPVLHHYVISTADGARRDVPVEPEWALEYWTVKSAQMSPDDPSFKIDVKSEKRNESTTAVPRGGDLARGGVGGGSGTTSDDATSAAFNTQAVFLNTMLLKGETVGTFDNTVIVPGLTFGWGAPGSKLIAYAAKNGRIVVMDASGQKQTVEGTDDALLPAWSPDGARLAWLEKDGRRSFVLKVAHVTAQ